MADPLVDAPGPWVVLPVVLIIGLCIAHNRKTRDWGFSTGAFVLQTVILREARAVAGRGAVLLAAAIFAAVHLPNPFLVIVTLTGGLAWCWIYSRAPNILPLALSHATATVVILLSFNPRITAGLRTGWHYLRN